MEDEKMTGQELYKKAKTLIPGGTQLLSKRPEMFLPEQWPSYYSRAKGCRVWDMDGREFTDMSLMGVGANVLGYADPHVDAAVKSAIDGGSMCTLNAPEEVELAEQMCSIHPWAEMARFTKSGGEAMAVAVRIARAATGRDIVVFSGYHGWSDWYLAANIEVADKLAGVHLAGLEPSGVPKSLSGSAHPFHYNDIKELETLIDKYGDKIAAVVMEPIRSEYPKDNFLTKAVETARKNGSIVLFDEISSAMRLCLGGAHLTLGVEPDIAVFAKGISNGYPQGIVIGRRDVMEAAQGSFISSTNWTERIGPTAALATLRKYEDNDVSAHLDKIGSAAQDGWRKAADGFGIKIHVGGIKPLSHFAFEYDNPLAYKTYFTQEMLAEGYLAATALYASFAHSEDDVTRYIAACERIFGKIKIIMDNGTDIVEKINGPVCHGGFNRLTK
jgi:glutamate-1-semialdehyde aminotransferase